MVLGAKKKTLALGSCVVYDGLIPLLALRGVPKEPKLSRASRKLRWKNL